MRSYRYGEKGKEESSEIQAKEYGVGIGSAAGLPQKEEADYRLNLTFTIVSALPKILSRLHHRQRIASAEIARRRLGAGTCLHRTQFLVAPAHPLD